MGEIIAVDYGGVVEYGGHKCDSYIIYRKGELCDIDLIAIDDEETEEYLDRI